MVKRSFTLYNLNIFTNYFSSVQFISVAQSCPTLCDPMNCNMPGLPVHQQLPEFTQTHVHWVGDAIQPSHPLSYPPPPALNLSQHQGLFKWVSSLHQVAKVLEFQLQYQSFHSGGDGIPVELFQILKDDAAKVLHSICQQIWKTQQWPQDWKVSFHSSSKERQCQRMLKLPHNCTHLTC